MSLPRISTRILLLLIRIVFAPLESRSIVLVVAILRCCRCSAQGGLVIFPFVTNPAPLFENGQPTPYVVELRRRDDVVKPGRQLRISLSLDLRNPAVDWGMGSKHL